ncbi:MAG: folylpolyglutamate synthase/dihydrofolate synthase family protein [Coriobacteriia bacterium]|nr:folylpolyglutamate synthase/dihydrofolate synthase family protein [Coriobacteriia bacterium]
MHFDAKTYINSPKWSNSRPGLERITELCERLGNPQNELNFIHVAGTNGKGSVCAYINQILIEAGNITGLFTSPFIFEFNERIKINNESISDEDLLQATLKVKEQADKMVDHPTEFELMTAVAFVYFAQKKTDIVVLEVGMGGRLDSTNVVSTVLASVITRIGLDHTEYLGNTLSDITAEKEGIIKPDVPVVRYTDIDQVSIGKTNTYTRRFKYKDKNYETKLLATYQPHNAALAIEAAKLLNIDEDKIKLGIANAQWPVRFDIVRRSPYVIIDGAHNVQGVKALIDSLLDIFPNKKFTFIMSVLADKDYETMVELIKPYAKQIFTSSPDNPRALDATDLANFIGEAKVFESAQEVLSASNKDDVIVCFGSLYVAGKLYNQFINLI